MGPVFYPRHLNTGLVSSGASLPVWGAGASLALVGHPSSDGEQILASEERKKSKRARTVRVTVSDPIRKVNHLSKVV